MKLAERQTRSLELALSGSAFWSLSLRGEPGLSSVSGSALLSRGRAVALTRRPRPACRTTLRAGLASSSQGHAQIFRLNNREVVRQIVDLVVRGEIVLAPCSVVTLAPKKGKAYKHGDSIGDPVKFDKTLGSRRGTEDRRARSQRGTERRHNRGVADRHIRRRGQAKPRCIT